MAKIYREAGKAYILSDRLRSALQQLSTRMQGRRREPLSETEVLLAGIALLEKQPKKFRLENIGASEGREVVNFSDLTDADLERINTLMERVNAPGRSDVARQAIEMLIQKHKLDHLNKPADWQELPRYLRQPGKKKTALATSEPTWLVGVAFPITLWNKLAPQLERGRGQAHSEDLDISRFVRKAMDAMDKDTLELVPVPPRQTWVYTQIAPPTAISLFARHKEVVEELQQLLSEKSGRNVTQGMAIAAVANQAYELKKIPGVRKLKLPAIPKGVRKLWEDFCENGKLFEVAEQHGLSPKGAADLLEEHGFISGHRVPEEAVYVDRSPKKKRSTVSAKEIRQFLKGGRTVEEASTHFNLSTATLYRKLKDEGC